MPITENNVTEQQTKLMALKNQGYSKQDVLDAQKFNGFADNSNEQGIRNDADLIWADTETPNVNTIQPNNTVQPNNIIQPNQVVPDIYPTLTETKQSEVLSATNRIQNRLSPGDLLKAEAKRIRAGIITDFSREPLEIAKDITSSVAQTLINNTSGLATGAFVAATAPNAILEAQGDEDPKVVAMLNSMRTKNPFEFMNDEAIKLSQAVSGMSADIGEALDSEQRKAQRGRYEEAKKLYQNTPEYLASNKLEQVAKDAAFTTQALLNNPLIIEDIGIQGLADLGTSILVGRGASAATKASLRKPGSKLEPQESSPRVISKKGKEKLIEKGGREAAVTAGATQGALTEAGSSANVAVTKVSALSHEELMDSPQYVKEYEAAKGTDAERKAEAKNRIAGMVARDTFVTTGLSAAAIGKFTGASKATGDIATGNISGLGKRIKAVGSETAEEAAQSAASTISTNVALETAKPDQNIVEGLGESIVQGAVGGGMASTAIQSPALAGLATKGALKLTGKGAVGTAKLVGKGALGAAKLIGKGAIKVAPSVAKGTVKVAAKSVEAAVKASGVTFGSQGKAPTSTTPVADVTAPIATSVEPITAITEPSEQVASIQSKVSQVQDSVAAINNAVENLDPESDNLGSLLMLAANTQKYTNELVTEAQATIDSGTATDVEVKELTTLIENISDPKEDSIIGALAKQLETVPALKQSIEAAFTAITTGNTEDLIQATGLYDSAGIGQKVTSELKNTLMSAALYSTDLMSDKVTNEQIQSAITNTTGATKAKYEAVATVRDLSTVASQVVTGEGEFLGINNHIKNIKSAMAKGEVPTQSINRLKAFAAQRTEKAEALEAAIATAESGTYPITATWGKEGTWTITPSKKGSDKRSSLEVTKELYNQVRVEEALVSNAVTAVNTLIGTDSTTAEPAEQVEAGATTTTTAGSEASPEQMDLFTESLANNSEMQTATRQATLIEDAAAKDIAVEEATAVDDLELNELRQSQKLRQERVATLEKRAASNDAFLPDLERANEALASVGRELTKITERRKTNVTRAERQFDLEQLDWDLGLDTSLAETVSEQSNNLAKDILTGLTGKRSITKIQGHYAEYGLVMTTKGISKFLKNKSTQFVSDVLDYITNLPLTKADTSVVDNLIGAAKLISTGTNTIRDTIASLNNEYSDKHDLGLDNVNRFQAGVIGYKESKLWSDTDYLSELMSLEEVTVETVSNLGITATEADLNTIKTLAKKHKWFGEQFTKLNKSLLVNLNKASISEYDQHKLRFLLKPDGTFPTKIVDAAFMAYINGTNQVTESIFNTNSTIQSLLGLSDESQLAEVPKLRELQVMGTAITTNQMGREFKQALGIKHVADIPQSVVDSVYSGMGGMLFNMLKHDPELLSTSVKNIEGIGEITGFTLSTENSNEAYRTATNKTPPIMESETNFLFNKHKSDGVLSQIVEPIDNSPTNWVGVKPPKVTSKDTHIRSVERLTDEQVEAENISRNVAHVIDRTIASFHKALGLEGFKLLKGYVEDVSVYNAEHKLTILGKNQEILDSYNKADVLIDTVVASENKDIYFEGAYSSVRRQQRKGAVNDQGNKYHRALIGLKNNATIKNINLNNLKGIRKNSDSYYFILALAQAYGYDVDKQGNAISVDEMLLELNEILNSNSIEADLASRMVNGELVEGAMDKDITLAMQDYSDHKIQGILTVARLISSADTNGKVNNFSHYMKAEIDGLTNGPAHSSFMNGLGGLSESLVAETMARGGYLVGDGTDNNTHVKIGKGEIVDSYKTVAKVANSAIEEHILNLIDAIKFKNPRIPKWVAESSLNAYKFLKGKGVSIEVVTDTAGKVNAVTLTRTGAKNPVTVTVYGGGASGIHAKLASEMRDIFAVELTAMVADYGNKKIPNRTTLVEELNNWSQALTGKEDNLSVITAVRAAKTNGEVKKALLDYTFDKQFRDESTKRIGKLYGKFATDAIDTVFKTNKRSANLMNVAMNYVTAIANDTYEKIYISLHEKRVEEGVIRKYDTLSSKDMGLVQRKLREAFPYIKTAINDVTNIANESQERIAEVGTRNTRYPTLDDRANSQTGIDHSAKSLGLPGVKAIPVLTISIDAAVQINNHLLQGKHGNFLNVLDAIDRIADKSLRASNEIFNVAEYMGIMEADTLAAVQNAFVSAIKAQTTVIEIDGIEVIPTLGSVNLNDVEAHVTLEQEQMRQALRDITNPIANEFGVIPQEIGNTAAFLQYLLKQLDVERNNNLYARNRFIFGNDQIAINQMAGIDNGHANIVKGQVVLSTEALALLDADGLTKIENFNQRMASRERTYRNPNEDTAKVLTEKTNTELENLRQKIENDPQDTDSISKVRELLSPLSGLWQDMRSTFNLETNTTTFKISGTNLTKFKQMLAPEINPNELADSQFGVSGSIPTMGLLINDLLSGNKTKGKDYLDNVLSNLEIEFTTDLPDGTNGKYETVMRGKKVIRTIKVREGITTKEAGIVLAHELIHAITQGGIAYGIANPNSIEGVFVNDLGKQMLRAIRFMDAQPEVNPLSAYLKNELKNGNKEVALNEYIAYVGSEAQKFEPFLSEVVKTSTLSRQLQKALVVSWGRVKEFLRKSFGFNKNEKAHSLINKYDSMSNTEAAESDVLAAILAGLGNNSMTKIADVRQSIDLAAEQLTQAQTIIKNAEGKSDDFIRNGFKLTAQAILNSAKGIGINTGNLGDATYESIGYEIQDAINTSGEANKPLSGLISTLAEFVPRTSAASVTIDTIADQSKHESDSTRETTKIVVKQNIDEALGVLDEVDNQAVLNLVLRGDIMTLTPDIRRLRSLLDNPNNVNAAVEELTNRIKSLPNVSTSQKNLMINEALSLGARGVTGGAYRGLNLPNAKAIISMVGTGFEGVVDTDGSITKMVDDLATLTGIQHSTADDRKNLSGLLLRNPEGVEFAWRSKDAVVRRISEQYGTGKLLGLPKGFVPEQNNPNRAIKVVPWADRNKYSGYKFVREFSREASDVTGDRKMALLKSSEGGSVPYVQGAMSTVEAAIGGFTTSYGSATDKSLPSVTSGAVVTVNRKKERIAAQLAQKVRQPLKMAEGMLPNVNSLGKVIGYRYVIDTAERQEHLESSNDVSEMVAAYSARITEQQVASEFNTELVDALYNEYSASLAADSTDEFVKVYSGSSNKEIAEIWNVIPQHTKQVIKAKFGGNFVYVRKRDLDNSLGYREWSISKLWKEQSEGDGDRAVFVTAAEAILGDNAVNKLRYAERILQEVVVAAKDIIVVKSIVVPVANIVSNFNHLMVRGVSAVDIIRDAKIGTKALKEYRINFTALKRAENMLDVTGIDNAEEINELREKLLSNPISFMVDAGLLSTIVEDVTLTESRGTVKEALLDRLVPASIKGGNNALIDAGKFITLTQGSSSYKFLADGLEAGDFVAKFILHNELVREGMDSQQAINKVRSEFINYNTLSNKQLDYLNKVGGVFFFKYFSRIQAIILNTVKENPTRALTTWAGADTVGLPSIFEAMVIGKDITATSGVHDLLNMAGNAHPISGL